MIFRPFKLRDTNINTHRVRFSQTQKQFQFHQSNQYDIFQMTKIKKARKIMEQKQQTLLNRIKVIKKQQEKITKKKQNQFKLFVKLQTAKKEHSYYMSLNKTPRKLSTKENHFRTRQNSTFITKRNNNRSLKSLHQQTQQQNQKFKAEKIYLEKIENAKRLKQQKVKNQVKISKQRTLQLNRKLQSAGMIRRNRQKVKETIDNFYRSRQQSIKHFKEQRIQKQKQKYIEIEKHIKDLQKQQIQALQNWKKVMEQDDYEFGGLKTIQIGQANQWMD